MSIAPSNHERKKASLIEIGTFWVLVAAAIAGLFAWFVNHGYVTAIDKSVKESVLKLNEVEQRIKQGDLELKDMELVTANQPSLEVRSEAYAGESSPKYPDGNSVQAVGHIVSFRNIGRRPLYLGRATFGVFEGEVGEELQQSLKLTEKLEKGIQPITKSRGIISLSEESILWKPLNQFQKTKDFAMVLLPGQDAVAIDRYAVKRGQSDFQMYKFEVTIEPLPSPAESIATHLKHRTLAMYSPGKVPFDVIFAPPGPVIYQSLITGARSLPPVGHKPHPTILLGSFQGK